MFKVAIKIFLISRQSLSKESASFSVIYSESISKRNQYSVSAVSLSEICNFEMKSALLTP